jgi:cell division protein FtsN
MAATPGNSKTSIFVVGMVVGLLLGIAISLGVALWMNRAVSPFTDKQKADASNPAPAAKAAPGKPAEAPKTTDARGAEPKKDEKSRFEFYQILPGDKQSAQGGPNAGKPDATKEINAAARDDRAKPAEPAKKDAKPDGKPDAKPDGVKPATDERVFVQAGAFPSESDADNLKGRIAFIGLQASVVRADLPEKGTWYRVRLGPYRSTEDATRAKDTLAQNGISATLVK